MGFFLKSVITPPPQIVIVRLDISMKQRDEVSGGIEAPMTLGPCLALTSNDWIEGHASCGTPPMCGDTAGHDGCMA